MFNPNSAFIQPIDTQIGTLLAFIILFQKKIEQLRIKLAGNEEFHSRLAFQFIDKKRKCVVGSEDLAQVLNRFSASKSLQQIQAFCRKYTANGSFSYDEFIKFLTPKTNKTLANRLMIRTYKTGAQLPPYLLTTFLQIFDTGISMITITQNLRKQIQQSTQLTHIELLEKFKQYCGTKQKLFYFINASTNGQGEYDFEEKEMEYLSFHVKGNTEIQDIGDHQIKEILCPLDMNFQKTLGATGNGFRTELKTKTDYFRTKNSFKTNENTDTANKTVNFLTTNYQKTSKNFFQTQKQKPHPFLQSKQVFSQPLDQNVQTKPPTPMMYLKNFPTNQKESPIQNFFNAPQSQKPSFRQVDDSSSLSSVSYGNLYIEKFARNAPTGGNVSMAKNGWELEGFLAGKYENQRKKELFEDEYYRNSKRDESDISNESAFVQY